MGGITISPARVTSIGATTNTTDAITTALNASAARRTSQGSQLVSIFNSLYIGVNGLHAHGDAISVVGDNIANASTVGFKRERAMFSDMLGGVIDGQRAGGGVRLGATQTMFEQGQITATGNPLDMAINGHGLFVVKGNHDGSDRELLHAQRSVQPRQHGLRRQPRRAFACRAIRSITTGVRSTDVGDLDARRTRQSPAVATTTAKMTLNLDSQLGDARAAVGSGEPVDDVELLDLDDDVRLARQRAPGRRCTSATTAAAPGSGTRWSTAATSPAAPPARRPKSRSGTMTFNTSGALQSQTHHDVERELPQRDAEPGDRVQLRRRHRERRHRPRRHDAVRRRRRRSAPPTSTAAPRASSPTSPSTATARSPARSTTATTAKIAQVAIASFQNEEGLTRAGDNLYAESADSGQPLVDVAGHRQAWLDRRAAASRGRTSTSSNELVTLIAYQRAFEANSKTVTTADQMLQTVTNLKQ